LPRVTRLGVAVHCRQPAAAGRARMVYVPGFRRARMAPSGETRTVLAGPVAGLNSTTPGTATRWSRDGAAGSTSIPRIVPEITALADAFSPWQPAVPSRHSKAQAVIAGIECLTTDPTVLI
jgi:hypothetical protein